jgi:hypothetical protein
MADDPNAKPPPLPEIIEETNWPHFLRRPADSGERTRRALQAAVELRERMADRKARTAMLYRAIAQFVARAMKESGLPRKVIIPDTARFYGVKDRTVETAIAEYSEKDDFTDGTKLGPAVAPFRGLPVELRLLALGLQPPH